MDNRQNTTINWYPGHMAKTKRQIIEDLKLIDVVVELLDARIPIASQNPNIKEIVGNKKKIVVLNKCDLAQEEENRKWRQYFKHNGVVAITADSNSGLGITEVKKQIEKMMEKEKQIQAQKGRIGKSTRIMVLGIPNVGKSSFINRMSKKTSAQVGNKPGVTKQKQWIKVSNTIELLDTPGVLWPKFENNEIALHLAFTGTIKDTILETTEIAYWLLKYLVENEKNAILKYYQFESAEIEKIEQEEENPIYTILQRIGKKRGALKAGGNIDDKKTADILLEDFRSGKLGRITLEKVK